MFRFTIRDVLWLMEPAREWRKSVSLAASPWQGDLAGGV